MAASGFIEDGHCRLLAILETQVRAEVETEYAEQLAKAKTWWKRWRLRLRMDREIGRRIHAAVSDETLF